MEDVFFFFLIDWIENRDEIREGDNGDADADSADHDGFFSPPLFSYSVFFFSG